MVDPSDVKMFRALQLVNEWLKFGEAKNAVLVTFNGAAIAAVHNIGKIYEVANGWAFWWFWCVTVCCSLSLLIGLASFYARTSTKAISFVTTSLSGANVVYFGHLADMTPADLLRRLVGRYERSSDEGYLEDMAGQVVTNAKLARKKFVLFNTALMWTLAGIITPVGLGLYWWMFCDENI
jgi:hypothetical protein